MRVTFGTGPEAVIYSCMDFCVVRGGNEEVELVGKNGGAFELRAVLRLTKRSGTVTILEHLVGADVQAIGKLIRAVKAARSSGRLELYNLRKERIRYSCELN